MSRYTVWKVSKYGVFSGPYFPSFGLNTEGYGVSHFSRSDIYKNFANFHSSRELLWLIEYTPFMYVNIPLVPVVTAIVQKINGT